MVVLRRKWATYMALPESEKSLFEGALLISHWINMDYQISPNYSDTELTLNWIVDRVKFLLMKTHLAGKAYDALSNMAHAQKPTTF